MVRLSIIVPFYNVERYIEQCISSLLSQDIPKEEYEIICVDDCSQDSSLDIVRSLQQDHSNLIVVRQKENHKQGSARNLGLSVAQGKYVWFIDSDDYIESNCLRSLLEIAENNEIDILHFDYKEDICGKIIPYRVSYESTEVCSGEHFFLDEQNEIWWKRCVEVWRRIHQREFLVNNSICFAPDVLYEDLDYSVRVWSQARSVKHINSTPYIYRNNASSVTHVESSPKNIYYQVMQMFRCLESIKGFSDKKGDLLISSYISNQSGIIRREIKSFTFASKIQYWQLIRSQNIKALQNKMSIKNWLAIRYGIVIS